MADPAAPAAGEPVVPTAREPRPGLSARLAATAPGRALLGCMQWAIVLGLVVVGYVGAEAIHQGVELATRADGPNAAQILASSSPRN